MSECPSQSDIIAFLRGSLTAPAYERIDEHIADCENCREKLVALRAEENLAQQIRGAHQTATYGGGELNPSTARAARKRDGARQWPAFEGYEITSEIHRGGQGVVYKALQKATKRTVALRVLLHGEHASIREQHRFEREVDLVASLRHPNIVTVYDSGVTADGRHYFAMEYIHGLPLDDYVRSGELNAKEILGIFEIVCKAVGHAHLHGVIHRDIKSANIKVDTERRPRLLDFGLARSAVPDLLAAGGPVTVTGEFMGTLAYASPEQTKGDPSLIDMRTDVYSLGVVLYELLTGQMPYVLSGRLDEAIRTINDTEPRRLSSHLKQHDDELDTIILKSLAKEKERRYHSATALGEDIGRYLRGEAIEAKRTSSLYVLRKAARRYRTQIAALALAAFVVSFGGGFTWKYISDLRACLKRGAERCGSMSKEEAVKVRRGRMALGVQWQ